MHVIAHPSLVSPPFPLPCQDFFPPTKLFVIALSDVDPDKHLICEPCDPKLVGGFDHDAKEVAYWYAFDISLK